MLPQHRDQHEDGGDEDDGQGDLADGTAREGLNLPLRALAVLLLVPARKCRQEQQADEGENDGDDPASVSDRPGDVERVGVLTRGREIQSCP